MGLEIKRLEKPTRPTVVVNARLYRTADNRRLVGEGHPDAAFLFATPGLEVDASDFDSYQLDIEEEPVTEEKAGPQPEDKAVKAPPEDKGATFPPETTREKRQARRKRR